MSKSIQAGGSPTEHQKLLAAQNAKAREVNLRELGQRDPMVALLLREKAALEAKVAEYGTRISELTAEKLTLEAQLPRAAKIRS